MSAFAEPTFALEPLTPRGVAAFARAPLGRLLLVQTVVAALATASILWLLYDGCFPTVTAAIEALPDTGEIRAGQLNWPDDSPVLLADKPFLAFVVDLDHGGDLWIVDRNGGEARRLTADAGIEIDPVFSPNGTSIAFTGEYDGNTDVFTIPAVGGVPFRVTYHPAPDVAVGWSPDGKRILFRSSRLSFSRLP